MSGTSQCTSTPINPSTAIEFDCSHPLAKLLRVAMDARVPVEARLVYVIVCLMAWSKHFCWPSEAYLGKALGRSDRAVRNYLRDLERVGLLGVERTPGRVNHYYPTILRGAPVPTPERAFPPTPEPRCRITLKSELKNDKNVTVSPPEYVQPTASPSPEPENVNASNFPAQEQDLKSPPNPVPKQTTPLNNPLTQTERTPLTTDQLFLIEEIEHTTGDTWSRGHFLKLVRQFHEQTIYSALSVTREKLALESGVNGGAYFTSTLKGMAQLQTMKSYCIDHEPTAPYAEDQPKPTFTVVPHTSQESVDPEPVDPEGLINGLRFSYKSAGVQSMLLWADRSVAGVDTHALWGQVTELLQGQNESDQVHRFLETLKVRLQHQSGTIATG